MLSLNTGERLSFERCNLIIPNFLHVRTRAELRGIFWTKFRWCSTTGNGSGRTRDSIWYPCDSSSQSCVLRNVQSSCDPECRPKTVLLRFRSNYTLPALVHLDLQFGSSMRIRIAQQPPQDLSRGRFRNRVCEDDPSGQPLISSKPLVHEI